MALFVVLLEPEFMVLPPIKLFMVSATTRVGVMGVQFYFFFFCKREKLFDFLNLVSS